MSNEFTKLAVRYPVRCSLATGGLFAVILVAVYRAHPAVGLGGGVLFAVANWVIWRPGGVGRRVERDVGDEPVNSKEIVKFVLVTVVLTGLVVLVYWLVG